MMKYMFVLAVLWQLQGCLGDHGNLRRELIAGLEKLTRKHFQFPVNISVPSEEMLNHACDCKGVFATELEKVLGLLNGRDDCNFGCNNVLSELKANVDFMKKSLPTTVNTNCTMREKKQPKKFAVQCKEYITFIRTLNEERC